MPNKPGISWSNYRNVDAFAWKIALSAVPLNHDRFGEHPPSFQLSPVALSSLL